MNGLDQLRPLHAEELADLVAAHGVTLGERADGELLAAVNGLLADLLPRLAVARARPARVPFRRTDAPPASGLAPAVRDPGRRPSPDEDPLNAVVRWTSIRGDAADGALTGVRVAVKDTIAVAGIPLTCGSHALEDYVPVRDSVVAERLLAAGAEIAAVANMDDLAISGAGDSSRYGPISNPFDGERTAGGSSGGSAAALFYDRVDVALGGDQAGSVRIPAAWSGVLGLKPTRGLVSYAGVCGFDPLVDQVGPMARDVRSLARLLSAIAKPARRAHIAAAVDWAAPDLRGVSVGVLDEGFDVAPDVAEAVRAVARRLASLGARVAPVSIPAHRDARRIFGALSAPAMATALATGGDSGHSGGALAGALQAGLERRWEQLSPYVHACALVAWHLERGDAGAVLHADAQVRAAALARDYDAVLRRIDVVLAPTVPTPARLPAIPVGTLRERLTVATSNSVNTVAANLTGHPALTLPLAAVEGLPVGVMLVGSLGGEGALLRIARTCERALGWEPR